MEIERKFLIEKLPFKLDSYKKSELEQAYIARNPNPTIRIRKSDDDYFLTVKGEGHLAREEFELKISKEQYAGLFQKTEPGSISKTRYIIPLNDNLFAELDIYHKNLTPLMTVEVEFKSISQANSFEPPSWFGREVTEQSEFSNSSLSKFGLPIIWNVLNH